MKTGLTGTGFILPMLGISPKEGWVFNHCEGLRKTGKDFRAGFGRAMVLEEAQSGGGSVGKFIDVLCSVLPDGGMMSKKYYDYQQYSANVLPVSGKMQSFRTDVSTSDNLKKIMFQCPINVQLQYREDSQMPTARLCRDP